MPAPLNIRDPRARALARELAGRKNSTITAVVIEALEHELAREKRREPLAERLARIAAEAAGAAGAGGREVTESERDAMWSR